MTLIGFCIVSGKHLDHIQGALKWVSPRNRFDPSFVAKWAATLRGQT